MHSTPFHRWLLLSAAAFVASQLSAQTTTWTSFEDRAGHAIAADPQGGVMMFGGESLRNAGNLLNDTNRLNAANTAWSRETHTTSPTARRGHAMVAAERQGQPVYIVFGGLSQAGQVADTWVNQGGGWGPRGQGTVPAARTGHGMVTDFLRNEVYLIGGLSGALPRNDVYRYDPNTEAWSLRLGNSPSGTVPPQRRNHCLAYDPGIDRVILFGGQGFAGTLNDTWAYDPTSNTWANLNPTNSPPPRGEGAMTYLLGFGVVLFGGKNPALPLGQQVLGDTWVFQSGNWTQPANLPTSPPARFGHAMSPDQSATNVVLLGGSDASGAPIPGTWLWNGSQWSEQLPAPSRREGAAMAYDDTRGKHVVFGGRAVANGADLDETWELEGLNWRRKQVTTQPSPRSDAGVAFDRARNKTVLFGGRSQAQGDLGDTWEWDGATWTPRTPAAVPPPARGVAPVFDSARNRLWMLVGSQMWSYDGTSWLPPQLPAPRYSAGSAFDSQRSRWVVFGGHLGNGATSGYLSNETWEWDGSRWWSRPPTTTPTPRYIMSMAYDATRHNSVFFGGQDESFVQLQDAWIWDGTTWTPSATAPRPSGRDGACMTFDPSRSTVVLFGGNAPTSNNETWEWDGSQWSQRSFAIAPRVRAGGAMTFFPGREGVSEERCKRHREDEW